MATYGQTLCLGDTSISVSGFRSREDALWAAAWKQNKRTLRKYLTKEQKMLLVSIARKKLFSSPSNQA